jgi:carboxyl-terminal processing protease
MRTGLDGMLNSIDPYTNYFPEDQVEDIRTMATGQYGGIGATTKRIRNRTVVTKIMTGYPAEKSGLKTGDEVLKIDGIDINHLSVDEANNLMRGQVGNPVQLSIRRPGTEQPINLTFKREKIKLKSVSFSSLLSNEAGYIKLDEFTAEAGNQVQESLQSLLRKGAKSIILDLRGNPGGLLEEAVSICGFFLPRGTLIVSTRGKFPESNNAYITKMAPLAPDIPMVVLIDRGSASASEIVAGTLQDYDRAVIIGEKSFGKGLVQIRRPLSYNSVAMITTAKYYTPSGRCIQVIDYSRRRKDGSAENIPDSLKRSFTTARGREVHDGGGIDPDISIERNINSSLIETIDKDGLLLDFVTNYCVLQPEKPNENFKVSDKVFQDFINWCTKQNTTEISQAEHHLNELEHKLSQEKKNIEVSKLITTLRNGIQNGIEQDFKKMENYIKGMLTHEIMGRFYPESVAFLSAFQFDAELHKALFTLNNTTVHQSILTK